MVKNKSILFFVDHLYGGGAERIVLDVANNFALNNNVHLALLDSHNSKMAPSNLVKTYNLNINQDFISEYIWSEKPRILTQDENTRINNLINDLQPDIIILTHAFAYFIESYIKGNIWLWVHGKVFNPIPKKTTRPHIWYKRRKKIKLERKKFSSILDNKNIICVNSDIINLYKKYIPNANFKVIHNGIDSQRLIVNSNLNDVEKIWDAVFIGRLSPEKQPHHALIAYAQSGLKGRLAIVGDGPDNSLNNLKKLSKEINIESQVDFLGWQKDVGNFILKSKTLILTSLDEGCPLIISEAIMLGTPVIAYNCSEGVYYQLNSNELKAGLVENQNIQEMALKIRTITQNPYKITSADQERLSIKNMLKEFNDLIK